MVGIFENNVLSTSECAGGVVSISGASAVTVTSVCCVFKSKLDFEAHGHLAPNR